MKRREFIAVGMGACLGCTRNSTRSESALLYIDDRGAEASERFERVRLAVSRSGRISAADIELLRCSTLATPAATVAALSQRLALNSDAILLAPNFYTAMGAHQWMNTQAGSRSTLLFAIHLDPVSAGLAASLEKPSLNATGFTFRYPRGIKIVEAIERYQPHTRQVGIIVDKTHEDDVAFVRDIEEPLLRAGMRPLYLRGDTTLAVAKEKIHTLIASGVRAFDAFDFSGGHGEHYAIVKYIVQQGGIVYTSDIELLRQGCFFAIEPAIQSPYEVWARQLKLVLTGFPTGEIPIEQPTMFRRGINRAIAARADIKLPLSHYATFDVVV